MKLSVVIPAYNEEEFLPRLLTALKKQTFSKPFEIIVADNNSTDNTAKIARSMNAKVVNETKQGFAYAANAAFFAATGDILIRSDADSVPPPQWLEEIYQTFQTNPDIVAVGGPLLPLESNKIQNIIYYPISIIWMYLLKFLGRGFLFTNIAIKKEDFYALKGFRTDIYGEDTDLCLRLKKRGKIIINLKAYTFTSIRRVDSLGIKNFIFKYALGNEIAKAKNKEITVGYETVRTVLAYNEKKITQKPWLTIILGFILMIVFITLLIWSSLLLINQILLN